WSGGLTNPPPILEIPRMSVFGRALPTLRTEIPGPESKRWVEALAQTECPAITARRSRRQEKGGVGQDPIVWERASGSNIEDVDGNVYVDLTSAFAVAGIGHAHPRVQAAAAEQSSTLIHAMGDVYPGRVKIQLAKRLADLCPGDLEVSIFAMTGAEAVEAALKTAAVATGKSEVIAFSDSYHGLSLGALNVTAYRKEFKAPFMGQLARFGRHLPFPNCYRCPLGETRESCELACLNLVRQALDSPASGMSDVGAVLVEPIQGRGGIVIPPEDWLVGLAELCKAHDVLLIFDEIYTGFGRTGTWFAAEHSRVTPDLMCIGKAMGGGFPISAVVGSRDVMERWGLSAGESIHTSTFLGNPLGCAMALASLDALESEEMVTRAAALEDTLRAGLEALAAKHEIIGDVRGRGAMFGVELVESRQSKVPASTVSLRICRQLLERGYVVLPSGVFGNVISLVPPFVITDEQLESFFECFDFLLANATN
ncbi:MAG: aspartate aminotransferase family protein, partial [Myxococcales bacterium]|nr:aspartate aminotransferase family protein [Myxococcales bacterium]